MITFRQAFRSLKELEEVSDAYAREHGDVGTLDELILFKVQTERRYVQCCFVGHDKRYTYEVRPTTLAEDSVQIGEYLQVYSPWTMRHELVRVEAFGRGSWAGPYKIATRIVIEQRV